MREDTFLENLGEQRISESRPDVLVNLRCSINRQECTIRKLSWSILIPRCWVWGNRSSLDVFKKGIDFDAVSVVVVVQREIKWKYQEESRRNPFESVVPPFAQNDWWKSRKPSAFRRPNANEIVGEYSGVISSRSVNTTFDRFGVTNVLRCANRKCLLVFTPIDGNTGYGFCWVYYCL